MTASESIVREVQHTFRSLQNKSFRAYYFGQLVSLCGTWMQTVALSWLIYKMTKSPIALGMVDCANLLPMLLFGLAGGAVADRFDRKTVLLTTQVGALLQSVILATLTLTNQLQVWQAICLAGVSGTLSAFEIPSRQALIVGVVGRENLVNAVSLNSSLFNGARTVGPAIAGIIIPLYGEGSCFVINSISFLAAIIAIASIVVDRSQQRLHDDEDKVSVKDALKFVWSVPSVRRIVCLAVSLSICGLQYVVLLPIFAAEVLHGDVRTLGWLRASAGAGAVVAALLLANRGKSGNLTSTISYAAIAFSLGLFAFALSNSAQFSFFFMAIVGFSMTTILSGGHSLVQLAVSDRLRGRVMSIYMMVVLGCSPIGSMVTGFCAKHFGAQLTLAVAAVGCLCASTAYIFSLRRAGAQADVNSANDRADNLPGAELDVVVESVPAISARS